MSQCDDDRLVLLAPEHFLTPPTEKKKKRKKAEPIPILPIGKFYNKTGTAGTLTLGLVTLQSYSFFC